MKMPSVLKNRQIDFAALLAKAEAEAVGAEEAIRVGELEIVHPETLKPV